MRRLPAAFASAFALAACATIPEPGGGRENLPSAAAGPFRAIVQVEIGNLRVAPNAVEDDDEFVRDPAIVDLDDDPSTLVVAGYFGVAVAQGGTKPTATDPTRAIRRYGALDGRSFDRSAEVVLEPSEAWEGGVLGQPSALLAGGETWLYYAAAGGIGLAKSADGHAFTRVAGPVLGAATSGWEGVAVPASPGVARLPDGSFRMFYEVPITADATAIGEASSPDGVTWTRVGTAPALAPSAPRDGIDQPYDDASVGSPFPVLATSADGRAILRVYYGARDHLGALVVGLAARYLEAPSSPLLRAAAPVFGTSKPLSPREPCALIYPDFTLLFATQKSASNADRPAVAAALSPALATLPPPNPM
jgi:hypothetical protein